MAEERADQVVESIGAAGGGATSTTTPGFAASGSVTREAPTSAAAAHTDDITVTTVSVAAVLAPNAARLGATIQNTGSTNALRVTLDGTNPSATRGILVPAGATLTLSQPYCPTAVVRAIAISGSTTVGVTELT